MECEIESGTVLAVHQDLFTCDVMLNRGAVLYNIGIMNSMGGPFSTDVNPVPNLKGAAVCVIKILNDWYVLGTIPVAEKKSEVISTSPTSTGTGTDNEETYGKNEPETYGIDYSSGRTTAFLQNDKLISADGGGELLLGSEGLTVLKASPLAQIILGAFRDFATIVAREFTLNTDFGVVNFSNGGSGVTGMSILGGRNFCDESGTNDPIYTFKMYAGSVPGDPLARFAMYVYPCDRSEAVRIIIDNMGKMSVEITKDEDKEIGRDQKLDIGENRTVSVHIDDTLTVDGNSTTIIGSNDTRTVAGDSTISISGNRQLSVSSSETHDVSGQLTLNTGNIVINTGGITLSSSATGGSGTCTMKCSSLNIVKA